jgi:uncharacterized protein YbaR (Trm112 family)
MDETNQTPDADKPPGTAETCSCLSTVSDRLILIADLGMDERYAEASLLVCPDCRQPWLRYFYELEAISYSGRWYLSALSANQVGVLRAADAKELLENLPWYFCGGSYYGGQAYRSSGKLDLS